jgi:hypothetical protein
VFPGWANHDSGPDFRQAVIAREDGRLLKGDVEVHVTAPEWDAHRHGQDPAYDGVVLHVVWQHDQQFQARTSAGAVLPTAWLQGVLDLPLEVVLLAGASPGQDARPCVRHTHSPEKVGRVLDELGEARFLARATALAGDAASLGEEQALWSALLDALGYSKNRAPFRELAAAVPFAALAGLAAGKGDEKARPLLEAVLLGASGLLLNAKDGERMGIWSAYGGAAAVATPWATFRVRPDNAPRVRVLQAARLAQRFAGPGLVRGLLPALGPAAGAAGVIAAVADAGPARASELAVNVVLPFFHGRAIEQGDGALANRCLEAYREIRALPPSRLLQDMERMLLPPGQGRRVVGTARRQQGLLQLHKQRCLGLLCEGCSLGR